VPTERDARKMAILCGVLSFLLPLLWITPTMAARLLFPEIKTIWPQLAEPAEASFVTLALALLPNGIIGVVMSALLAATTSSVDTGLNYLASIIVRDVYVKFRPTVPSEKQQLRMGRITVLILGGLAIISALIVQKAKGVFDFALMYYSWFTPSMLTPVMLGLIYTKTPSWSAMVSATIGLLLVLAGNTIFDFSAHQYEANVFIGVFASAFVFFASSFFKEKDSAARERIGTFAQNLATPATVTEYQWDFNAMHSYKVVGVLTAGVGAVLILLMLVPASIEVRSLNLIAGLSTLTIGLMMVWYFKKKTNLIKKHFPSG